MAVSSSLPSIDNELFHLSQSAHCSNVGMLTGSNSQQGHNSMTEDQVRQPEQEQDNQAALDVGLYRVSVTSTRSPRRGRQHVVKTEILVAAASYDDAMATLAAAGWKPERRVGDGDSTRPEFETEMKITKLARRWEIEVGDNEQQ
jgi:hypothetical protein